MFGCAVLLLSCSCAAGFFRGLVWRLFAFALVLGCL